MTWPSRIATDAPGLSDLIAQADQGVEARPNHGTVQRPTEGATHRYKPGRRVLEEADGADFWCAADGCRALTLSSLPKTAAARGQAGGDPPSASAPRASAEGPPRPTGGFLPWLRALSRDEADRDRAGVCQKSVRASRTIRSEAGETVEPRARMAKARGGGERESGAGCPRGDGRR